MKRCIWCSKKEDQNVTFFKKAHTFPQSLNGKNTCINVCDKCNHYFGSPTKEITSVETALKEALNISKQLLFKMTNHQTSQKTRYKSDHFKINWEQNLITPKPKYLLKPNYQERLGRQLRRGFFKVYLEERERQLGDAHNSRFDFIREFARYDLGDYPVFVSKPREGVIFFSTQDVENPTLRFTNLSNFEDEEFRFYSYQVMGHNIVIPTSRLYGLRLSKYAEYLNNQKLITHNGLIEINTFEDLDFSFRYMNKT